MLDSPQNYRYMIKGSFALLLVFVYWNVFRVGDLVFDATSEIADERDFIKNEAFDIPPTKNDQILDHTNATQLNLFLENLEKNGNLKAEAKVFKSIIDRAASSLQTCNKLPKDTTSLEKNSNTPKFSNTSLPEFGIVSALSGWLLKTDSFEKAQSTHSKSVSWIHNLTCSIPAEKSCHVDGFTVVFMSHSLERLATLARGIRKVASWKSTHEIVLVWNSDPGILQHNSKFAKLLQEYHSDPAHPLRIFYALDNGLQNNLFNRYHPLIKPKMEAVLYFDDDGPFFEENAMNSGFELWKRNSGQQVGCFPRNIIFKSERMIEQGRHELEKYIKQIENGSHQTTANNGDTEDISNHDSTSEKPQFVPTCQSAAGDKLAYNFYVFPQFQAHILLPSGSFIHRNFLCWLWHPALEEIRQYILDHPTHPDDMSVSTIISHLTGKAPRVFSRRILSPSRFLSVAESSIDHKEEIEVSQMSPMKTTNHEKDHDDIKDFNTNLRTQKYFPYDDNSSLNHRNLLWQQENWADMREEAIASVIGYFGSINPGSVGWCTGTEFKTQTRKKDYTCDPEFPQEKELPWMVKGGLGNDEC